MNRFVGFDARSGASAAAPSSLVRRSSPLQPSSWRHHRLQSPRFTRRNSHVQSIELRTHVFIDSFQPQLAAHGVC